MNGEVNGVFIYNGQPQNGAIAQLWKIVGFAAYADSTDEVENNPIAATDIELDVNAGGTFAIGDVIKITDEVLRVTHIDTNKLYVIRGYRGTTPAIHAQNTQIDDETITEPSQDTAVPAGSQQGGDVTTGVAYGGDGAYRWTAVPEGEYYVSVTYDSHIAWLYFSVESNDPSIEQILRLVGDLAYFDGEAVTRLPITAGKYLGEAGGIPVWGSGPSGTKEFWVPSFYDSGGAGDGRKGDFVGPAQIGNGGSTYIDFKVPHDYTAITNAELIVIPDDTQGTANWDIDSDYGAIGEAYNTHSETDAATTYNVTDDQLYAVDVSGILSALAADDYVGLKITVSTVDHELMLIGFRLKYT